MPYKFKIYFRLIRRSIYRSFRQFIGFYFGLFLKKIYNPERLPARGPCLIVSNHVSYLDSLVISSIYKKQFIVILASTEIRKQPIMCWLSKFNITIFVDMKENSISYLKHILTALKEDYIVLVYPEGTRSRNGCMGEPKSGFVKIAHALNIPIIPIGMKGTFNILPPHKVFPRFKRCEVFVGEKLFISKDDHEFINCFDKKGRITKLGADKIAIKIMNRIAEMINQSWDNKVIPKLKDLGIDV